MERHMTQRPHPSRLKGYHLVMRRIAAMRDRAIRTETAEDFAREIAMLDGLLDLNGFLRACRDERPAAWPAPPADPTRI